MEKLSVVRGNGFREVLKGMDLEQTIGEFLSRFGNEDFFLFEQSLKSLNPNRKLSELACFHGPMELTTASRKRPRMEEEEEEVIPVSNPPLFYQNSFLELPAPEEEFCSKNVWEFVEHADKLEEVYLLSFIINADTVKQIFPAAMLRVPVAVVVSDKHDSTRHLRQCFEQVFPNELSRLIYPNIPNRFGSFHSKLMILFYPKGVRVVIHTSNIEMSNLRWHAESSWSQDFPLKQQSNHQSASEFELELGRALQSSGIPEAKHTLSRYDFSIAEVALVLSIPSAAGYSSPNDIQANGLGRVKFLLEQEGTREPEWKQRIASWPVVAQSSSLGSMNSSLGPCWLINELGEAFGCRNATEQMRLVVISQEFAHHANVFGENALNATRHMKGNFVNPLVRQALCTWTPSNALLPTRANVVPHVKTYTCSSPEGEIAWLILGSHNCTQAAWGSYTKNYAKLRCISHEVSVMFLPSYIKRAGTRRWDAPQGKWFQVSPQRHRFSSINKSLGFLPVPYALPVTKYDYKVDEPFYHDE